MNKLIRLFAIKDFGGIRIKKQGFLIILENL